MRNYRCPNCGAGRRAPNQLQPDDARRYCLECSGKTGRMVLMTCPAKDKAAVRKKATTKERRSITKAKVQAAETARWTFGGRDVREVLPLLESAAGAKRGSINYGLHKTLRYRTKGSGHAYYGRNRVTATFGYAESPASVLELLLHEICHLTARKEYSKGPKRQQLHHGLSYNRTLCRAAHKLWPWVTIKPDTDSGGYGPSRALEAQLMQRVKAGECIWPDGIEGAPWDIKPPVPKKRKKPKDPLKPVRDMVERNARYQGCSIEWDENFVVVTAPAGKRFLNGEHTLHMNIEDPIVDFMRGIREGLVDCDHDCECHELTEEEYQATQKG